MQTYVDHIPDGLGFVAPEKPSINWRHIEGPLLYFRDGQLHLLTIRERLLCWLGLTDAVAIERKRRPNLCRLLEGDPALRGLFRNPNVI